MAPVTGMTKIKVWVGPDDDLVTPEPGFSIWKWAEKRRRQREA